MSYLYNMPECQEYIACVRRKAFEVCLKKQRQDWLDKQYKQTFKKYESSKERELLKDVFLFVYQQYIIQNFDKLWEVAHNKIYYFFIATRLDSSFKRHKQLKQEALENFILNPENYHPDFDLWMEKISSEMINKGVKLDISTVFLNEKIEEYTNIFRSLSTINDNDI